jgi:hypothetical protein
MRMAPSMQQPSGRAQLVPSFGWDVTLRRGLCDALGEVLGIDLEGPELPTTTIDGPTSLVDFLAEHLEFNCLPVANDDMERYQLDSAIAVAHTLQLDARIGDALLAGDLEDMGAVLGSRPADREEGFRRLAALIEDDPESRLDELVPMFARIERRREHLWRPMMIAQSSGAFEPLGPPS